MQNIRHCANRQQGSALVIILIMLGIFATVLVSALKSNPQIERDKIAADVMAKAKEALIGYAATYRDGHPGDVFGYLPCPAIDGNGVAGNCGSKDVTLIGLLPWKTLGLPPLRDSSGECLWYAVSGNFKNSPKTTLLNWDTAGQLIVNDAGGAVLASGVAAVIFSPRGVIGSQDRTPVGTTECGTGTTVAAYLDGGDPIYAATVPAAGATTTLTVATTASIANATNNDQGLWLTPDEIFRRIKQRRDFNSLALPANPSGDVNNLLSSAAECLNALTTLPEPVTINFASMAESAGAAVGSLTIGRISQKPPNSIDALCSGATGPDTLAWRGKWNMNWWNKGTNYTGKSFNNNWYDNLLYAKCTSGQCLTVNGPACAGVLIFAGERAGGVSRATAASKNVISNYLEGTVLSAFTTGGTTFNGATSFSIANNPASADVLACINPQPPGPGSWNFEYPTQWAGVPSLDAANVAVGGTTDTSGTSGNDDVSITGNLSVSISLLSGNDELLVTGNFTGNGNFGAGDDVVKIEGYTTGSIDLGSGNDYLDIGGNSQGWIDAGSGDDKILVGGDATASMSLGAGNDELHIKGSASSSIDAGNGDNKIRIDGSMSANIQLGSGNDYVLIFGDAATMDAGSGDDIILIGGNATAWLNLGAGNDYLEILGNSAGLDAGNGNDVVKITGAATNTIDLGAGDDILRIGETIIWIDGGGGTDRVFLLNYTVANCATLLTSNIGANVEHVKVSDGMCKGSDFTVP